jgi:hypothetical protein
MVRLRTRSHSGHPSKCKTDKNDEDLSEVDRGLRDAVIDSMVRLILAKKGNCDGKKLANGVVQELLSNLKKNPLCVDTTRDTNNNHMQTKSHATAVF